MCSAQERNCRKIEMKTDIAVADTDSFQVKGQKCDRTYVLRSQSQRFVLVGDEGPQKGNLMVSALLPTSR